MRHLRTHVWYCTLTRQQQTLLANEHVGRRTPQFHIKFAGREGGKKEETLNECKMSSTKMYGPGPKQTTNIQSESNRNQSIEALGEGHEIFPSANNNHCSSDVKTNATLSHASNPDLSPNLGLLGTFSCPVYSQCPLDSIMRSLLLRASGLT